MVRCEVGRYEPYKTCGERYICGELRVLLNTQPAAERARSLIAPTLNTNNTLMRFVPVVIKVRLCPAQCRRLCITKSRFYCPPPVDETVKLMSHKEHECRGSEKRCSLYSCDRHVGRPAGPVIPRTRRYHRLPAVTHT